MMGRWKRVVVSAVFGAVCAASAGSAWAQQSGAGDVLDVSYNEAIKGANQSYNEGDYEASARGYVQAIQSAPAQAAAYRNLARSYFWLNRYAAAMEYYDLYLQLVPAARDSEQVQSERRLAADRAGDGLYRLPESQQMARKALEVQLESGPAYTPGGGGAWGLYEALLRTGYARPDLETLRRRLSKALLEEVEAGFEVEAAQPVPRSDLPGWQVQARRLEAAAGLEREEERRGLIERRELVTRAGVALLTGGNSEETSARIDAALRENSELLFLSWFRVVALMEADQNEAALGAVESLGRRLAEEGASKELLGYARVLRATILRRLGREADAAQLYLEILE